MVITWIFAFAGTAWVFWFGQSRFALEPIELFRSLLVANIAALLSLLMVQEGQRRLWAKKTLFKGKSRTWLCVHILSLGLLWAFAPALRDIQTMLWLYPGLLFGTGYAVLVYGPLADRINAAYHRKTRR